MSSTQPPILIDGSTLEGGGQILRVTTACSLITRKPLRVIKIRANRPKPGLSAQHVSVVALLSSMMEGTRMKGGEIGSCVLEITPPPFPSSSSSLSDVIYKSSYTADCGTAGAISLITQAALPSLIFSPTNNGQISLMLKGGTNVNFSPPIDHTELVLLPLLRSIGFDVHCEVVKRGYYPTGGGEVNLKVTPTMPSMAISLTDRGQINKVTCTIFGEGPSYGTLSHELGSELKARLEKYFADLGTKDEEINFNLVYAPVAQTNGHQNKQIKRSNSSLGVQISAYTTTNKILSANHLECSRDNFKDSPIISNIVDSVLGKLSHLVQSGACVDEYTADQLIVFMAFLPYTSRLLVEPSTEHSSLHLQTSIEMIKKMSDAEFIVESAENGCRLVVCTKPDVEAGNKAMEPIVGKQGSTNTRDDNTTNTEEVTADKKAANIERLVQVAREKAAENRAMIDNKNAVTSAFKPTQSHTSSSVTSLSTSSIATLSPPLEKRVRKKR